jgi:hypothetical protein
MTKYAYAVFRQAPAPLELERLDTRLYLHRRAERTQAEGLCVGSFWLQNPGSARYENPQQKLGAFAALQVDPLMRHLRAVLDEAMAHKSFADGAYVEILNVHYFADVSDGPKGAEALRHVAGTSICSQGISDTSQFLVLGVGAGWAAKYQEHIRVHLARARQTVTVIAPKGPQTRPDDLAITVLRCGGARATDALPPSTFPNPVGASRDWKERYVRLVGREIAGAVV